MSRPEQPIRLYHNPVSGHAHRVELLLALLGLPYELVLVDMAAGAHKSPEFLAKNAFGQVPVIEDGEVTLADSNAILVYLASRYDDSGTWLPRDPVGQAEVQRWLSVAAGQLAYGPGLARVIAIFGLPLDAGFAMKTATQLFTLLDAHLAQRRFVAADHPTIADVALYSYTARAPEGKITLEPYANIRAWLGRIEALEGFVPMGEPKASRPA